MFEFFNKIITFLNSRNIPYMLSGSFALSIYVLPRATRDIDFVVKLLPEHVDDIVEYFNEGYYCSKDAVTDAISRKSMFNIIDHASGFKADFVIVKDEKYRITEFDRRRKEDFNGIEIFVVSPEDLLLSKLIWIQQWQAAVQMEDIKSILNVANLQLDYIKGWVKVLNLKTFGLF